VAWNLLTWWLGLPSSSGHALLGGLVRTPPRHPRTRARRAYGGRSHGPITEATANVVDLLVMGSRGYGPVRMAVLGSVSAGLVDAACGPVLVVPRGAAQRPDPSTARFAITVA
jgi:hypothetical protein